MRNPDRIDSFCDKLKEYWHKVPDWRFSQLIINIYGKCEFDPWFLEENDSLKLFEKYFEKKPVKADDEREH